MEDETATYCNGDLRRWWLLKKALAGHSLADALKLAKEAEAFITTAKKENSADSAGQLFQILPATNDESAPLAIPASTPTFEVDAFPSEKRGNFNPFESNLSQCLEAVCLDNDIRSSCLPRQRMPELPNQAEAGEAESEEVLMPSNTVSSTFAILASMQEIIKFLRQYGDVVASTPEDKFLVSGRFQENATELLSRANRIRNRQGKPPFEVLVANVAGSQEVHHTMNLSEDNVADRCSVPRIMSGCE